jgi:hypothetical protein
MPRRTICSLLDSTTNHTIPISCQRHFSQSWAVRTQQRDDMWAWFAGAGKQFKRPTGVGPIYLGEASRRGRQRDDENEQQVEEELEEESNASSNAPAAEEVAVQDGAHLSPAKQRASTLRRMSNAANESSTQNRRQPLRPFPENMYFHSEPVLGEDLREAIFERVKVRGFSVREASEFFKVSMERIAAVVRMKQMERNWLKEVS